MPTILPNAKNTFFDGNGNPLAGGSVALSIPGTSVPKNTYQDQNQTILNPNPIRLDASGSAMIWGSGSYRQQVYDANGNLIWDKVTEDTSGALLGNYTDNPFLASSGGFVPGTTTQLTLSTGPGSASNAWVFFDGVYQAPDSWSLSGTAMVVFGAPIPAGVQEVNIKVGGTIAIGTPSSGTVTDASVAQNAGIQSSKLAFLQLGAGSVVRTVQSKMYESVSVTDFGADPTGVADSTTAFKNALNSNHLVFVPAGSYLIKSTLTIQPNLGMYGEGNSSVLLRGFNGGALVTVPNASTPFTFRDLTINTATGTTAVSGDTGLDIGSTSAWYGGSDVRNLIIQAQWYGWHSNGGLIGIVTNVQCINNLNTGFYCINQAFTFLACLSQRNAGMGWYCMTTINGNGSPTFIDCTSFANQSTGLVFDTTNSTILGANVFLTDHTSSFDGAGIYFNQPYNQIWMNNILIEYSGQPSQFTSFPNIPQAVGLQMTVANTNIQLSNIFINTAQGNGCELSYQQGGVINNLRITNSGMSQSGSAFQCGMVLSNNNELVFTGMTADQGNYQTTDISMAAANNDLQFIGTNFRTYVSTNNSTAIRFVGVGSALSSTFNVPSAAALQIFDYTDFMQVTGTTAISSISSPSMIGRRITLLFQSALTVQNTGNILLSAPFNATVGSTLNLVCEGNNWYQG